MRAVNGFTMFVLGAGIGAFTTWYYLRGKYEKIVSDEIESIKEAFGRKTNINIEEVAVAPEEQTYKDIVYKSNYAVGYNKAGKTGKEDAEVKKKDNRPRIISPDDFGEIDDYERISLTYYSDDVLTDEFDEVIDDADSLVGIEALDTFGMYEDDSVFVRNDTLKCDYEILLDIRTYEQVLETRPYLR